MQVGKTQVGSDSPGSSQYQFGVWNTSGVKYRCHLKLKQKAPSVQEN